MLNLNSICFMELLTNYKILNVIKKHFRLMRLSNMNVYSVTTKHNDK